MGLGATLKFLYLSQSVCLLLTVVWGATTTTLCFVCQVVAPIMISRCGFVVIHCILPKTNY
jgi:hypothetical protein